MEDESVQQQTRPSQREINAEESAAAQAAATAKAYPAGLRGLAHFFSAIFHPLLVPTFGAALFFFSNRYLFANYSEKMKLFGVFKIFLHTAFFPAFTITLIVLLKFARSVHLRTREERVIPFVATGFFYIWAYVVYRKTGELPVLQAIILGPTIAVFAALMVNQLAFKISVHTLAMGGLLAAVLWLAPQSSYNVTWIFVAALFAAALTGTSRLILHAHEPREVYAGYLVGFLCQAIAFRIILG